MKKSVLYARVSSDIQQKERTIESQIAELKSQILKAGDILVKEYIDDGYSGAKLDRPALEQLREDLKTDIFETIYFLNADRIARDVTYQNIIISEILKYNKQIIINGQDYIHNPENKFTLTVLGAVSELERAKMIERSLRGKQHRLKQGFLLGQGHNTYGYTYIKRSDTAPAAMIINEEQAKVIRHIFETYAYNPAGLSQITRKLEDDGILTQTGKKLWAVDYIKRILNNHTYTGIKYFNRQTLQKVQSDPLKKVKYGKKIIKDPSLWIGVKVPAIVTKELFEMVQKRLKLNKEKYRNPRRKQLLSNLVKCGECGSAFYPYGRYYRKKLKTRIHICHRIAYACTWRLQSKMHSKNAIKKCHNPQIKSVVLEKAVFDSISENMFDPRKLRTCLVFKEGTKTEIERLESKLSEIDRKINRIETTGKRMLIDRYASGELSQQKYVLSSQKQDEKIANLQNIRNSLIKELPLLIDQRHLEEEIYRHSASLKEQFRRCKSFEMKRSFLLENITEVNYLRDTINICGSIKIYSAGITKQVSFMFQRQFRKPDIRTFPNN